MFKQADRKRAVVADPSLVKKGPAVVRIQHAEPPTATSTLLAGTATTPSLQPAGTTTKPPTTTTTTNVPASANNTSNIARVSASPLSFLSPPPISAGLTLPSGGVAAGPSTSSFNTSDSLSLSSGTLERVTHRTAADRAREAASRVPSPPLEERLAHRKKRAKSVVWQPDHEMEKIRWFRKVSSTTVLVF